MVTWAALTNKATKMGMSPGKGHYVLFCSSPGPDPWEVHLGLPGESWEGDLTAGVEGGN